MGEVGAPHNLARADMADRFERVGIVGHPVPHAVEHIVACAMLELGQVQKRAEVALHLIEIET